MPWAVPAEGAIADRYRRRYEQVFAVDADGTPLPGTVDASPGSVLGANAEVADETHTELYLHQDMLARELMPDTAIDWLPRHAAIWGVPRLQPAAALGDLVVVGVPGAALPAGIEAADGVTLFRTTDPATIPASGAVAIPASAESPGSAGNRPADAQLQLVSTVAGLTSPVVTVDQAGMAFGRDLEDQEAWRSRILARIRIRGEAATEADYRRWAIEAGAVYVQVLRGIAGAGTVGVYVGMAGPATPTPAQLAAIDAAIQAQRPVCDVVTPTLGATPLPVPVTLALSPDSAVVRSQAQLGLQAYFLAEARPGTVLPLSRLNAAVASSSGEYAHLLLAPAVDVAPAPGQIPALGAVTFQSGAGLPQPPAP